MLHNVPPSGRLPDIPFVVFTGVPVFSPISVSNLFSFISGGLHDQKKKTLFDAQRGQSQARNCPPDTLAQREGKCHFIKIRFSF
jgi:hypothetical protein